MKRVVYFVLKTDVQCIQPRRNGMLRNGVYCFRLSLIVIIKWQFCELRLPEITSLKTGVFIKRGVTVFMLTLSFRSLCLGMCL